MKHIILLFIFIVCFSDILNSQSLQVSLDEIQTATKSYLATSHPKELFSISQVNTLIGENGDTILFEITTDKGRSFTVERGAEFTAQIVPCANCGDDRTVPPDIIYNMEEDADGTIPETSAGPSDKTGRSMPQPDIFYPNPTDGEITVGVDGEVHAIVVYNVSGNPVGGWHLRAITPDHVTLDLSPLPAGTYMLRITTPSGTATKKLLVTH